MCVCVKSTAKIRGPSYNLGVCRRPRPSVKPPLPADVHQLLDVAARVAQDEVDDRFLDAEQVIVAHLVDKAADELVLVVAQPRCEQRQHAPHPRPVERRDVVRVDAVRYVVVVPTRRSLRDPRTRLQTKR